MKSGTFLRRAVLLLLCLALLLPLVSCGDGGQSIADWIHSAADRYFSTEGTTAPATSTVPTGTAPSTTAPVTTPSAATTPSEPATTAPTTPGQTTPGQTADDWLHDAADSYGTQSPSLGHTVTVEQLHRFLDLVDYEKAGTAEWVYAYYYIGSFRTVYEMAYESREFFDTLIGTYRIEDVTDREDATTLFINTYIDVLGDRYGYYYSPAAYEDYEENLTGQYSGIGVSVTLTESNYIEILAVFADSPADGAGLEPGDLIVAVEGQDVAQIGYQPAVNLIQGVVGTSVTLTIERDGVRSDHTMLRAMVTETTVEYKMLENQVGYIRITSFNGTTYDQFVAAYTALEQAGATSLVYDLRNNPGGTLNSVVAILEYILPDTLPDGTKGDIVHLRYKDKASNLDIDSVKDIDTSFTKNHTYYENHEITLPSVVLANGNTASAGELFTSSMQDYGAATVVGVNTYGKGVGQNGYYVSQDGSIVTLTLFFYDPPTSVNYDGVGITPDLEVALSEAAANKNIYKLTFEEDTQLQAAYSLLTAAN